MMKLNKKAILIIVEGKSDRIAMEIILRKLYKHHDNLIFYVKNGDITSDEKTSTTNIKIKIQGVINEVIMDTKLKTSDFIEVALLVDTDGCFVTNDVIEKDKSCCNIVYREDKIIHKDIESVIKRNKHKSEILNFIISELSKNKICGIMFKCFFMSCNLEHVLYNVIGLPDNLKMEKAYNFAKKYIDKEYEFLDLIYSVAEGVPNDYLESWEFIKNNNESLKRHTNFNIFINENPCGKHLI